MFGKNAQDWDALKARVKLLEMKADELQTAYEEDLAVLRRQLLMLKKGEPVDDDAILEGRMFGTITARDLDAALVENPNAVLLDVRTDEEWVEGHHPKARHIDIRELETRYVELPQDRSTPIYCVCAVGARSAAACEFLASKGYSALKNVEDGMMGYRGDVARAVAG